MQPFEIHLSFYSVVLDSMLDRLTRSNDPKVRRLLKENISNLLATTPNRFDYRIDPSELVRLSHIYSEQYVDDLCVDVDQFFAIANGRYFVPDRIRTELIVLYLFGSGKTSYRPNITAFSAAGETIAAYCLEQFGYTPLVRPLGVMPDIVFQTSRGGETILALTEAKASTADSPRRMIEHNSFVFFLDTTTRAKWSNFHYEGYLVASQFKDQHVVDCACLHVDLGYCRRPGAGAPEGPTQFGPIPPYDEPGERLRSILRVIAECAAAKDRYLTELLTEEAKRTATIKIIKEQEPLNTDSVTECINQLAHEMGVSAEWADAQEQIGVVRATQDDLIRTAVDRYKYPRLLEGPKGSPESAE